MRYRPPEKSQMETLLKRIQALEAENRILSRALTEPGPEPPSPAPETETEAAPKDALHSAISRLRAFAFQETDPRLLLKGFCRRWKERLPYPVWAAQTDAAGTEVLASASAGFSAPIQPMIEPLADGKPPEPAFHALKRNGLVLMRFSPPDEGTGTGSGAGNFSGWTQWTRPLADPDRVFGFLSFLLPPAVAEDRESNFLLSWLADDLAFALKTIAERNEFSWLQHIIVNSPHPLSFVSPGYRYEIVNQVYAEFFAVRREKILGRSVAQFLGEEFFQTKIRPRLDRALAGETVHYETEANFPGRGKRWMEMRYVPHRNPAGRITGVFSYGLDVTARKQVEQAHKENESRYREHFAEFPIPLFVWHRQGDRLILVDGNQAAERITRGGLSRLLGIDARELYAAEENRHLLETLTRCFREKRTLQKEFPYRAKTTGADQWIRGTWVFLPPDLVVLHTEDVTGRKAAEAALREKEARFKAIFEGARDALFIVNSGGRLIEANPAAARLTGYSREEMLGMAMSDFHDPADLVSRTAEIERVHAGESTLITMDLVRKDGRKVPAEFSNTWFTLNGESHLHTVARDISDRVRAEAELRESEKRFKLAMEASRDGIWDWDVPNDRLYTSSGYARLLGYGPEEIPGAVAEWEAIVPPEDWETVRAVHADCIENRIDRFTLEFRVLAKDGTLRWIRGRGKAVERDADGRALRLVGTHTDITARKTEAERQARLEEKFHQTQKMESIGRLAGGVAHDLNNLLSPILGYSEMLLSECAPGDGQAEILAEIEKAGLRGRDLVRRLLTFSRKQNLEVQPVNMNHLLTNFEKLLRRAIREDVAIEMQLDPDPPTLEGDPGQLEQVIMNLAVNAQDAMPEGGRLTLATDRSAPPSNGAGAAETAPDPPPWIRLRVGDTGQGMAPEIQGQIFEPFFTTKAEDQGTGLGLSTVYGIVRRHGGEIRVSSRLGEGTAVSIFLPVPEKPPPSAIPLTFRTSQTRVGQFPAVLVFFR